VLRFLAGADWVVAHNAASTERRHLIAAMRAAGVRPPPWRLACTLSASRVLLPRRKHHGLASLAQHYDIELEHHDPESDALACARLAHRLVSPRSLSDWAVDW
jgi:DNA polymerase-3 subunit epsilon